MVRGPVKKFLRLFFSEDYYKSLYVGYSGLHLLGVLYLWTPMPYLLWDVQNTLIRLIINSEGIIIYLKQSHYDSPHLF